MGRWKNRGRHPPKLISGRGEGEKILFSSCISKTTRIIIIVARNLEHWIWVLGEDAKNNTKMSDIKKVKRCNEKIRYILV